MDTSVDTEGRTLQAILVAALHSVEHSGVGLIGAHVHVWICELHFQRLSIGINKCCGVTGKRAQGGPGGQLEAVITTLNLQMKGSNRQCLLALRTTLSELDFF